ncbi:CRISPR-associated endoribonuclease Cas6 [Campylobacter hominis]|uniref:CRISPR-associated endoribonuclease Cas6 n=1 Tax=Campylobacter hominis TaxID=76517 RepID=UPI000E204B24|nr:CRISPR-associated endoribonuclease Cas6 [Campylobacter hominis]
MLTLKNSLETNLKNKFSLFVNDSVSFNDDIIELIEIKNDKPFMFPYKGGKIFAYRYKVYFANNSYARELAKIALALGLGEKGSLTFGFCEKGR